MIACKIYPSAYRAFIMIRSPGNTTNASFLGYLRSSTRPDRFISIINDNIDGLRLDQGENAGGRIKMRASILVLLLAFLISAANGLEVRVSQNNGASGASISMNYGALKDNFVDQDIKVNPVFIQWSGIDL
jgi:hypothetical protein